MKAKPYAGKEYDVLPEIEEAVSPFVAPNPQSPEQWAVNSCQNRLKNPQ